MHASAVLVGLNLFFFIIIFLLLFSIHGGFFSKKKTTIIILNLKNVTVFGGKVVFFFFFAIILGFFCFFSTDVISQTKEYDFVSVHSPVLFICLFGPFFFILSCKRLVLQDLERCILMRGVGRVLLPHMTLRRCWKQRLKQKGRTLKGGEERTFHGESYHTRDGPVWKHNHGGEKTKTKNKNKLNSVWELLSSCIWFSGIPGGVFTRLSCENDCDVVTLRSHNSRKIWGERERNKMHSPAVLAY